MIKSQQHKGLKLSETTFFGNFILGMLIKMYLVLYFKLLMEKVAAVRFCDGKDRVENLFDSPK